MPNSLSIVSAIQTASRSTLLHHEARELTVNGLFVLTGLLAGLAPGV